MMLTLFLMFLSKHPPKSMIFIKKKKEKLRLLQSFRFRHLQSAPALGEGSICERLKPSSEIKE